MALHSFSIYRIIYRVCAGQVIRALSSQILVTPSVVVYVAERDPNCVCWFELFIPQSIKLVRINSLSLCFKDEPQNYQKIFDALVGRVNFLTFRIQKYVVFWGGQKAFSFKNFGPLASTQSKTCFLCSSLNTEPVFRKLNTKRAF
jgi:hypothetical protein